MMLKQLYENFIKTSGNASFSAKLTGISEGHGRRLLSGLTIEEIKNRLLKLENQQENDKSELLVVLSDIHYGEMIEPNILNGNNKYNAAIARSRVKQVFYELDNMMHSDVKTVHIMNLGDPISGMLHFENLTDDEMSPIRATNELGKLLIQLINFTSKEYPNVKFVIHSVLDNHARTTQKRRFKNAADYSFNSQLVALLDAGLDSNKNVKVNEPKEDVLIEIGECVWAFAHGDRGNGGSVAGSIKGQAAQRLQAIENAWMDCGKKPDYCMIGHFHSYAQIENWFVCPAICGPNEYSTYSLRLKPKPARTLLFECSGGSIVRQDIIDLS